MSQNANENSGFVAYEYTELEIVRALEGVYRDGYPAFGWAFDGDGDNGKLRFKRPRKLRNKAELSRLQRQFDTAAGAITRLEGSKTASAFIAALTLGIVGTAFIAISTFALIYRDMLPLTIIAAIPGFAGWGAAYPLYMKLKAKRTAEAEPIIDQKYDELYAVCEQAKALLDN